MIWTKVSRETVLKMLNPWRGSHDLEETKKFDRRKVRYFPLASRKRTTFLRDLCVPTKRRKDEFRDESKKRVYPLPLVSEKFINTNSLRLIEDCRDVRISILQRLQIDSLQLIFFAFVRHHLFVDETISIDDHPSTHLGKLRIVVAYLLLTRLRIGSSGRTNRSMSTSRSSFRRSSRSASTRRMSKSLELPSSLSSDIFRIVHHLVLVFCRRVVFAPPKWKIGVFYALILLGPFLKDVQLIPNTFAFALKINMFNKYISQLGWTCSIVLLMPFVYLTSLIYARGHYGLISRHLIRLVIGTIIWYLLTTIFTRIEALTSMCKPLDQRAFIRRACRMFDRSSWNEGQTFLYLYALLVINEEVKLYDENWRKVEEASKLSADHPTISSSLINQHRLRMFATPIDLLYIALAVLTLLWELMLLSTAVYFYNFIHKLCAASLAVFFWLITYHLWFRQTSSSSLAPCSPGDGFITF